MKIRGWFIDGFGIFRDYEVRELPDGLTVLYGPNEAGKTTLLWFLRGVLFGFPDGRSGKPQYVPLRGGRHGGRVFVAGAGRDYVIDRSAGRGGSCVVTGPDRRDVTPAELTELLGGADEQLFRNVFAFTLTELESFESLAGTGIRERIFSAGIAGAGRSAREVIDTLNERAARLVKHRGQARVNSLAAELQVLRRRCDEARQAACSYVERVDEERRALEVVERLGGEIEDLRRESARYLLLTDLWPLWRDIADARGALEELEPIDDFPADPETRLAVVSQALEAARGTLEGLVAEQRAVGERQAELHADDSLRDVAGDVDSLGAEISLHRDRLLKLDRTGQELAEVERALDASLAELGDEWDVGRIEAFDCSASRREEIREWEVRLQRVARDVEEGSRRATSVEARLADAQARRDRIVAKRPDTEPPDATILSGRQEVIRRLRVDVGEQRAVAAELAALESVLQDRDRAMTALMVEERGSLAGWLVPVLWVGGGVGAGVGLWRITQGGFGDSPAWILLSLLLVLGAGGVAVLLRAARAAGREGAVRLGKIEAEMAEALRMCEAHREKSRALVGRVGEDAAALSLGSEPNPESIEECERQLGELVAERVRWDEIDTRLVEADAEIAAVRREACECSRECEACELARDVAGNEWEAWKAETDMPASLTTAGGIGLFDTISRIRETLQTRLRTEREVSQLEHAVHTWEERSRAILGAGGFQLDKIGGGEEVVRAIRALSERCRGDAEVRRIQSVLSEDLERLNGKIVAAEASLARCEAERSQLFAEAGVPDEGEFLRGLQIVRQRRELGAAIRDRERELLARIGTGPEGDSVRGELRRGHVTDWQEGRLDLEQRIAKLRDERDEALRGHRDAERARRMLEESTDIVALDGEREAIMAELSSAVHEWRVLILARALIEETLHEFERSRQPAVLAQASRAFGAVTGGRYERIVQTGDGSDLAVLDHEGRRRHTGALSRGTAEQLYVCVRLGLAAEFARRSTLLPLVMDDILVNFDATRARALAKVLVDFAERHQLLLFTCHSATRDLIAEVGPKTRIVELPVARSGSRS